MVEDHVKELLNRLEERLTEKQLIRKFGLQKKEMQKLLHRPSLKNGLKQLLPKETFTCGEVLECCGEIMDRFSPVPEKEQLLNS